MNSKTRVHRTLNKTFGDPTTMSNRQRMLVLAMVSGWVGQRKNKSSNYGIAHNLVGRQHDPANAGPPVSFVQRHASAGQSAFVRLAPPSHWVISPVTVYSDQAYRLLPKEIGVRPHWGTIASPSRKQVEIGISMIYHLTVAKHGVSRDGKKLVQRIWDHRDYDDKQVWQCEFWDLSCLSSDEGSWMKATQHQGYVVKTATQVAVDVELQDALRTATRRTVRGAIKSILADVEQENTSG